MLAEEDDLRLSQMVCHLLIYIEIGGDNLYHHFTRLGIKRAERIGILTIEHDMHLVSASVEEEIIFKCAGADQKLHR